MRRAYQHVTGAQMVALADFDVRDDALLRKAVSQSNVVINLMGLERETPRFRFEEVHIDVARRVAEAARDSGVCERLLHISCLGASLDAPSRRLRTKVGFGLRDGGSSTRQLPGCLVGCPAVTEAGWASGGQLLLQPSGRLEQCIPCSIYGPTFLHPSNCGKGVCVALTSAAPGTGCVL